MMCRCKDCVASERWLVLRLALLLFALALALLSIAGCQEPELVYLRCLDRGWPRAECEPILSRCRCDCAAGESEALREKGRGRE